MGRRLAAGLMGGAMGVGLLGGAVPAESAPLYGTAHCDSGEVNTYNGHSQEVSRAAAAVGVLSNLAIRYGIPQDTAAYQNAAAETINDAMLQRDGLSHMTVCITFEEGYTDIEYGQPSIRDVLVVAETEAMANPPLPSN